MNIFSHMMMTDSFSGMKPDSQWRVNSSRTGRGMSVGVDR